MSHLGHLVSTLCLTGVAFAALAGEPNPIKELNSRPVKFFTKQLTLREALAELRTQTGNTVNDARAENSRTNPTITLPAKTGTFWQSLDAIGKETKIGFSTYQPDGGVALVNTPYRELKTHYSGVFRFAFKRVAVSRAEETDTRLCQVTLDVAWEPRFRPLYLNLEQATAAFGKRQETVERQGIRPVAGMGATEIELLLKAPERRVQQIDSLKGTIRVIGAPKMLEFTFAKPAAGTKGEQEGVKVRLADVKQMPKRWEVELETEYPEGAIVKLESFQSWMHNNRVWLAWTDAKTKNTVELEPREETPGRKGPGIVYLFTPRPDAPLPPQGANVMLHYRTPNRVVAFTVPFVFQDLPLP